MSLFGNLMIGIDYSFKSLLIYIYTDEANDNAIEVKYIYEQFYLNWNILYKTIFIKNDQRLHNMLKNRKPG